MSTIKHLNNMLVCLDLTDIDHSLISYASFISKTFEADKIIFMHVIQAYDLPGKSSKKIPELSSTLTKKIEEEINSVLSNRDKKHTKTEVVTKIEDEDASEVILDFIKEENVDLTLIGQKLGSDREGHYGKRIAAEAESDLLFVPEGPNLKIDKILCALDFSKKAEKAFSVALDISKETNGELICHYIHDTSNTYFPVSTQKSTRNIEKNFQKKLRKFLNKFKLTPEDIKCRYEMKESLQSQAEKTYLVAEEEEVNLIIIGAKGKTSSITSLLGNVTENLRRMEKEIPVMIMKNLGKKRKWI